MPSPIELAAPACLPFGLVRTDSGLHIVGLALRHPPVALLARASPITEVSGAGYVVGQAAAQRLALTGEVEIELAPPLLMGLGAEPLLQLSVGRALAAVNDIEARADAFTLDRELGLDSLAALEIAAFTSGGLLNVTLSPRDATSIRRHPLTHPDERAWVVVLYLPKPSDADPDSLEAEQRAALFAAARHLKLDTERVVQAQLEPALLRDDFHAFACAIMALHQLNADALAASGAPLIPRPAAQAVLDLLRAEGVPACGPCLTGLGVFALIQGAQPSIELRKKMMALVGHGGGTVMATITDNEGCRVKGPSET